MQSILWLIATSGLLQQQSAGSITPEPAASIVAIAPDSMETALAAPRMLGPVVPPGFPRLAFTLPGGDSAQGQRPRVFEYSRAYETRLAIHHWASYATIPLFVAEYYLGQRLFNADTANLRNMQGTRDAHRAVALGVAGLFGVNTITGAWNLWDGRKDLNARLRRFIHAGLMIASDAGFVASGASAPGGRAQRNGTLGVEESRHRTIAIASMVTSLAGYVMMLVWK